MLVKQDSCRFNNTGSFLYTVSCKIDIVVCIIFIGREIPPNKHSNFCLIYFFALDIHRVHILSSDDVLLHPCFKGALFK